MHKKIIGLLALTFCAVAAFALAGCSSQEEYAPSLGEPTLAPPAIGEEGVLRVGVNTQRSPLAGQGNEKIIGIDVDIASAIADELGLKVDIQDVGADADKALAEGEVDIVMVRRAWMRPRAFGTLSNTCLQVWCSSPRKGRGLRCLQVR